MARSLEHLVQKAYFDWARRHPQACCAFAVPNGGQRHPAVAAKLKAEGVRAGVLDVFLPKACHGSHGLWIEFKAGRNDLSEGQLLEAARLIGDGYTVLVCWDDPVLAIDFTQHYLLGEAPPGVTFLKPSPKPRKAAARLSR